MKKNAQGGAVRAYKRAGKRRLFVGLLVAMALGFEGIPGAGVPVGWQTAAFAREPAPWPVESIPWAKLPPEAQGTLTLIAAGGPYRYEKDGTVFRNFERQLPARPRGYYHEYTVPTPRSKDRGARRIVCGGPPRQTDDCFYSDDHYNSFKSIVY
jgi:ribonuclease T1